MGYQPTTNEYSYTFINKVTGEEIQVRASDAELATLKAWQINQNLTFKIPQIIGATNAEKTIEQI